MGLPAFAVPSAGRKRAEHDAEMIARLHQHRVDLVCLAGYMRILTPEFVRAFPGPDSQRPPVASARLSRARCAGPGAGVRRQVAGCTVHFVDEAVDHGAVIVQRAVPVLDDDTAESLSARILEQEHIAYPEAIARIVSGEYRLAGRRYVPAKG